MHPKFVRQFEEDARTQVRFHIRMAWVWAICMVILPFIPVLYGHALAALIIQEISLYANWATELGALSAAQASSKQDRNSRPDIPLAVN